MKYYRTRKFRLGCALFIAFVSLSGCNNKVDTTSLKTEYVSPSYVVDMDNPAEVVGLCTHVFVGYVEEMLDTYYISNFPYTRFNVKVINNIKGELPIDSTVSVNKEGGISEDNSYYIFLKNDSLPLTGAYYIFNTREKEDGSYTASGINTCILIDDICLTSNNSGQTINNNLKNDSNFVASVNLDNPLKDSLIYQNYVSAYENEVPFDPSK